MVNWLFLIFNASLPTCSNLCGLETPMRGNIYCLFSHGLCGCNYLFVMKSRFLMTLPVMISSFVYSDDCLSYSAHTCLWSLSVMLIHTICVIWDCVYCLWTDSYILVLSSLVIIVCDRCFLTPNYILLVLSTCPIPNYYIVRLLFSLLLWVFGTIKLCALSLCELRWILHWFWSTTFGSFIQPFMCFICFWSKWSSKTRHGLRPLSEYSAPGELCFQSYPPDSAYYLMLHWF